MNKGRYRLVFSDEHRSYVPVPEETCARGKNSGGRALRRLVAAMAAALPGLVIANPTGHQIVQGQVGIQAQGSTLNITASDRAIINWKQFSIQPGETTRFIQPHSTATVLNRVVGQDPSQILGNLIANGRVFLINPNGVLFGAGAKVDTAGLVASTLNISNEDFTAGRLKFNAEGAAGKLRNEGTLKTTGGPLLLIATDIENTGLITADNGDIVLAAGKSVEIADPHQPALRVRVEAGGEAINLGQLIARGGNVGMFGAALTQAGKISATGAHRTADGRIVLRGSKSVTLTAQSETTAKTADGAGGNIDIAAPEVKVEAGALVEASGTQGGRIDIAATQKASVDGTLRATGTLPAAPAPAPAPTSTAEDIELPATGSGPAPVATTSEAAGKGGHIEITADTVLVGGNATLDASGDTGGGSVLVGGDWQGGNPQVRNAQVSWIGGGARLLADALFEGDGGKVVVWADQATAFHGNIWARGGERGGNGGQVEVSGKVALLYRGRTDTSAARGRNGVLLLDPLAMVIQGGSGDGSNDGSLTFNGGAPGTLTAEALGPTVIYESEIEEQSKTTDIILRAQRSVTVGGASFSYTASGNADGETTGQLTLAEGSSLLIETRNLGGEEGGPSAGIDLVTGGAHGASLRIVAQGDGGITMQTGYSNGVATGDQRADIIVPVLTAGEGNILLRTMRGTGSTIQFRNAVTTGGTLQTSADTHTGSQHLQGDAGVSIDGDYIVDSGTLDIDGASAAISGTLFLSGTLDGNTPLTLGGLVWYSGVIAGTGAVTLTGTGELPQNYNYRYLDRELVIAGTLDLKNNYQLYVRNGGNLHLGATGILSSSTHDGNIYLTAGASGTATFSADAGARIEIAAGRRINLYSDGNGGNQFSSRFELSGDGALALSSGNFSLTGDSVIAGSGNLALSGADLGGSGNLDVGSNVVWTAGRMYGSGTTTFSGLASLPQATNNKVLQRRLDITGTLDLDNNYWLYVQNGGTLHIGSTGTVRTRSNDGNIYLNAGASGIANFSADDGAQFEVAAGRTLRLFSDNNAGNQFSAVFELGGAGTLALTSGSFTLQGDSSITGSGTLALSGGDLTGSGNLDIGSRVVWTAGGMYGTGTTTFSGMASLPQATNNKTLQRRLDLTGTLDLDNNYWLYVQNGGTLHVSSTGTVRTTGNDGYIYLNAGASGVASFSTDDGATIAVVGESTLRLFSDGNTGNRFSAVFELGGAGTLALSSGNFTLLGDSSITGTGTLALSGADLSGSGNLDIASSVIWSAGRMSGTGTTTFSGAASLPQVNSNKFLQRRLEITGTLDLNNNYALYAQNGGSLHVASTGVLRTTTGDSHLYFDAGASGVTNFSADEGARIEVAAERTLRLYSDGQAGNQFSAHLDVTGEGTLSLNGGRFTLDGDSVIGGSGNYLLNLDLAGSGNITLRDNFTWSGGNMSGSGRTVLDTSVTLSGTRYLNRELVIAEDRTLLLNDNAVLRSSDSTNGGGRVTAIGTLAKGTGSGNAYLQYLDITGNIESRGGLLRLHGYSAGQGSSMGGVLVSSLDAGGVLVESGTFHVTGSSLQIAADSALNFNAGTLNMNSGSVTGTGNFRMNGGTLNVSQDSVIGSRFTLSDGTLTGDANLTLSGNFEWAGGTMSGTGRTVLAGGTAGTIANVSTNKFLHRRLDVAGTLNFANSSSSDLYIRDGGALHIASTGTLTTTSNGYIYLNEGYNGSGNGIAAMSSETGGRIAVADGTTLFINGDNADGNRLRGTVELSGPGAVQINSGLITVDAATSLTGDGALRLNGGSLATDAATSIAHLQITGGTLSGTATVTLGDLLWQSGTISGDGTAVLAGTGTIDSTSAHKYLHRRLVLDGTLTLANSTNYDLYIRDGGTLHIGATGTLATSANGYIYFNEGYNGSNNGIAALTSAAGGRIAVVDGSTLFLTADSSATNLISGSFALAGPGALQINSGLITVDQNSAFNGAGLLRLNGGTLYAGAATSIANLDLSGGTLDGPATVTLNKLLWRSGSMEGAGTTVLAGSGTLDSTGGNKYLQRQLVVDDVLTLANNSSSDLYIRDGGTLHIASTGTLATTTNGYIYFNEAYNGSGNGQTRLSAATGGRIAVAGGSTLFLTADGSTNNLLSGNFLLDGPGVVQLNSGALTTDLATQLSGPGVFRLAGGSLTASAALGIGNLELNGSSLTGSGDITVFDRFVWNSGAVAGSGVLTLAGNSTLASNTSYKDASREIRVSGNLTVTDQNGYGMRLNNARLAVLAGGSLTLENDARITHTGTGRLDNAGLLVKRGPSALTLAMPLTNTGTLRVEESTLSATAFPINDGQIVLVGGATLSTAANLTNNGSIAGRGTISVGAGTLTNAGLLQPGGDGAAGVIAIQGNFVQTSAGALEAELLGSTLAQQDQVQVSGTIVLGGDLEIMPAEGVTLGAGNRYTVLSCSTLDCLSGMFDTVDLNGLTATQNYFSNALSFANGTLASTWVSPVSGDWHIASNWDGNLLPTASTDVVIDQAGDLTITVRSTGGPFVVNSLYSNENISIIGGSLTLNDDSVINGRLTMTGGSLTVGSELGLGSLSMIGGTITGGRLIAAAGSYAMSGGTLNALEMQLGLRLSVAGTSTMQNVTLSRLGSNSDAGLVQIGNSGTLEARGTLTLDGATIRLASTGSWTDLRANASSPSTLNIAGTGTIDFAGSAIYNRLTAYRSDNTLNVGSGITVTGTQSGDIYMGVGGTFSGTALASTASKTFEFSGANWTNAGTLRAAGGTIALTSTTGTNWTSTGSLDLDSGALTLGGNFNTASFNTLDRDGVAAGTLYITGALNNTGATLLFDDSTGAALLSGSITGGTLHANNPAGGALRMNGTGYLIDTTLAGVDGVEGSGLFVIDNGQAMEARGTLTLDGATIRLASTGSWTDLRANASSPSTLNIAGTGTIDFAGSAIYNRLTAYRSDNTLNVGSGITVTGTQSGDIYMGVGGTFSGTALASTASKTFEFSSNGGWTSAGTLRLQGGSIASTTNFTNSGAIYGDGSLNAGSNTVTNTGLLRPDGLLVLTGNLVLGGAGTVEVGIAGTERGAQYDALDVSGTVTFGGTLRALHEAGFTPGTNAGLRVVRYNARMAGSTFASLDVPAGFGYGSYYGAANYVLGTGSGLTGINEWINNSSGNWSVGSNWSLGVAPNAADQTVLIDRVGYTPTVTISTGTWIIGSLSSEEALTISGGSLTVNGATRIGSTLSVSGGRFEALGTLDLNAVSMSSSPSQFIAHGGGSIASFDQTNGTSTFNSAGLSFLVLTPRGGAVNFNAAVGLPSSTLRVAGYVANINADLGLATLDIDSGSVNLNIASSAADIDLGGGTLNVSGTTAMSGDLTWTGGSIAGGGVLTLSGVLDQTGSTTVNLNGTTLNHSNTSGDSRIANTSGDGFNIENGGVLRNSGALTLSVEAPASILYIDQDSGPLGGRLENTGILVKTGAGRADIGSFGNMTFVQDGAVLVEGGSLTLGSTVNLNGTQTVAADALLQVTGGSTTLAAGRLITGAGSLLQSGGTLLLGNNTRIATAYTMSGGTLTLSSGSSADIDGRFTWTSGTLNGGGVLDLNGEFDQSGNITVYLNATTLQLHDDSGDSRIANTSSSGFNLENGAVFRNTGTLALISESPTGNLYIDQDSGPLGGRFENTGTLTKSGAGNVDFGSHGNVAFDQLGTFVVSEGTATLNNAVLLDGTQQVAEGALMQVNGGTTTLTAGRRIDGTGSFRLNSGTLALGDGSEIASGFTQAGGTALIAPNVHALISGRYDWIAGTISGGDTVVDGALVRGGTLTVSGELQQVGTATATLDNATLVHTNTSGNSTVGTNNGRSVLLSRGAVFSNAADAVLTLSTSSADNTLYIYQNTGTGSRFENFGTLIKTGGGTLDLGYNGTLAFAQSGTLQVNEGTLLTNAAATYSGTQQIAAGALLRQNSGAGTLSAGASFAGFGPLRVNGGTLTLGDGSTIASDLILTGSGNLNVAGGTTADIDGDIDWVAGNITGTGTLMLNGVLTQTGTGTVSITGTRVIHTNISGDSRIGNNNGRSFVLNSGAVFRNAEDATLTLDAADNTGTLYVYQSSGSGSLFENLGTLSKTGSGTVDMGYNGNLQFIQGGSLIVQQGSMTLNSVTTLTGVQQIAAAATLNVRGGTTTLISARVIEGGGTLSLSGGTLTLSDSASIASILSQSGGTLQGSGTNIISGRYEWTDGTIAGSGTLAVSGPLHISSGNTHVLDGRTLAHENAGGSSRIYKTSGALYLNNGAVFRNAAGARLLLDSGNGSFNVYSSNAGSLLNEGTITKVGSGSASFASNVNIGQSGTLTLGQGTVSVASAFLNSGTMNLLSDAVFANSSAATTNQGTIGGFGSFALGSRTFTNSGVLRPGGSGATGTLSITGNFVQDASGTLQIERGSSGTDALAVTGTATLGGALVVTQLAGYAPVTLQTNIVTAGSLGGGFATQSLPSGYSTQVVGNSQILSYAGAICGGVCWDGGAGTLLWTDAANWTTDLLPGTTDLVFIDLENGVNVQLTGGTHTIASLTTTAGNTLSLSGGALTLSGGASGQTASALAGDLVIGGGSFTANAQTSIARLLLSAGSFGGSGAVTFTGTGSSWTGGDMVGSGSSIFAAGSSFEYAAGTRSSTRRVDVRQGATVRNASGSMTLSGGATNAGVIDVALGATVRYGGSASYLLDTTGQFDGGGRIEFIDSAVATAASTAPAIADGSFTVRVQDSARFTMTAPTSIANLELAGNGQAIAQAGFQAANVTQSGGTLTVNAASAIGRYNWNGGTFAGSGSATLTGQSGWTRGTLTGNLVVANGATLTLSTTGSDDVQGTSYKRFGAGSLSNFGTLAWQEGHIDVVGNARVDNAGLIDITGNFSFGDRSVGVGTLTLNNLATGTISKSGGGETSIGTLGIPGGTANYAVVTNNGRIDVASGSLRFGIGYAGAPGGGSFTHNGQIDVFAGALLEFGGSLTHNGVTFIDSGATLRRIGGFTNAAGGLIEGFGTIDVGAGNTLRNDGTLHVGDLFNGVYTHGTMRVTGHFVQGSGGQLLMAIGGNAAGEYDQLAVSGSATLGGALVVSEAPGYVRETVSIDLITTGAGLSNSFATVTLPDAGYATSIAGNALHLSYNALVCGGICWDGGAGTNLWTDAANWSGDVLPGVNDLVFIALGGGSSVLLNSGSHTIAGLNTSAGNHLTINGASLTLASLDSTLGGNLTLGGGARVTLGSDVAVDFGGALNWTSAATLAGGTLNLLGGSTATLNANTNGGHLTLSGITINNAGTVNYASEGRQLLINDGTTFNNSGRFNFTTDGDVTENSGFGGNFNNSGTVAKTGGSGNSAFTSFVRFNNLDGGTVDSGTGSLLLQTGGDHAGAFNIVGSNVRFNGGAHTFATGSTLNGIANFGGATVNLSGATVDGQLNLQGGTINQAAGTALNVDGAMRWDASATISGGTLNLLAGSSTTLRAHTNGGHLTLSGVTVNNMGTVNYASEDRQLLINDGTTFNNSGRFNFTTDGDVTENSGFGGNFNNSGTLAKTGGSGSSGFASFVRFNNLDGGTVDSGTGSLLLQTGGNHAGVFNIVGSNVRFNAGTHTFATGATLNGIANFGGATVNLSGARIQGALNLSGGTLNLARNSALDIAGTMNWDSAASISGGGELNLLAGTIATLRAHTNGGHLTLSGVTVNNMGTVNYASEGRQLLINDSTTFNNSGRFNFTTDGDITENSGSGGNFNNSGTIAKTSGTGRSGFASFVRLVDQGGSYRADSGTLDLSALSTLSGRMDIAAGARIVTGALSNGGIIAGNGTLDLGGALLTNRGVLQPGGAGAVGTLTVIGGLQQDDVGRIEAEFAGTAAGQHDVLDVRGNTLLDGVLAVQAISGAQPSEGMGLAVVTADGTLEAASLVLTAPSGNYSLTRAASTLRLGFTNCAIGICWDGGAGTANWLDAANWTGDVLPGLNDLVFINLAGGADVVLNASPSITLAGLTIGDANSLTLTGGSLNAPTTVQGGGTLTLQGGTLNFGSALSNAGTLNYVGGVMNGTLFTNSGTLNVLSGSNANLTTTRLNNTGSIVVDASRTVEFGSGGGMIFANDGDVQVRSGTLSVLAHDTDLSGPGADSGDYTVDANATLRFRDAFRDFGPGSSITGAGDVEFTAFSGGLFNVNGVYSVGGTTRVSGNTLVNFNSNASFGSLAVAGNIGGTGTLTVAEDLVWTSGSIGGAGRSVIVNGDALLDGASLNLTGARLTIADSGLIDAGTRVNMSSGAQLIVATGASLGMGSNAAVGGSGSLVNRGTLEGTVGGGSSNIGVLLSNFGEVSASSGNLGLTGGIANTGAGSFVIGADATMELGGDLPPDIFDRIGGAGTLSFSPTSQPVINRSYAAQGGAPFSFSLRSGAVLTGLPQNGTVSGEAAGWIYTANAGFNGTDSARFTLSLGGGTAVFNISFAVTSAPAVTQPQVQVIATTLLPEVFQPPRIVLPSTPPQVSAPINVASVDALSDIATASGPQFDQPLRDFRASRLQCR